MKTLANPLAGILVGFVFTAVVQSSAATASIVIVMADQGVIPLEAGIAIVFGANIGTCITAFLSALGRPREALRVTLAHALFNVVNAIVVLFFAGSLAALVRKMLPERATERDESEPRHLDPFYLAQPALALDQVERELARLAERAGEMVRRSLDVVVQGDAEAVRELRELDDSVDRHHAAIVDYLGKLSLEKLVESDMARLQRSLSIAGYIENVGDVVSESVAAAADKRLKQGVSVSESAHELLLALHAAVLVAYEQAGAAIASGESAAASAAAGSKKEVARLAEDTRAHLVEQLESYRGARMSVYQLESDLVEDLKRINTLTRRIGRAVLADQSS
jgi:phosphate:Na+ symporter